MLEESIPPERNDPRGTSATISIVTTRSKVSSSRSCHHASLFPSSISSNETSHHSLILTSLSLTDITQAGGSVFIPLNKVFGSGDQRNVRNWCRASGLSSFFTRPVARIALISEAKINEP